DALAALAAIALATDRPRDAIDDARAALAILQQTGHRLGQANAHLLLGRALHYAGQPDDARHHWQRAHTLYTDFDSPAVHDVNKILTEPEPGVRSAGSATPRRPK